MRWRHRGVEVKTPEQIALMRRAGLVVATTLEQVADRVRPGVRTEELDTLARDVIRAAGAAPSFLGYEGFPASLCISVNDEVVHGIPGARELSEGDLVSIDCGAVLDGWHGDAAITVAVGRVEQRLRSLVDDTDAALWAGIAAIRTGGRVGDVSHAVEVELRSRGSYGILEDYTGHGIGSAMHQPPDVPNLGRAGRGARLVPGMAIAVEPMVTLGTHQTLLLDDDWTVVTADGSWAAHIEHTVAITERGLWVLTAVDGGQERLAALGVPFGG